MNRRKEDRNDLDLTPYLARGFGPDHDRIIANTPVRGIDQLLSHAKIRLAPETEGYLYTDYTPLDVRYKSGSRPKLERIAKQVMEGTLRGSSGSVRRLLSWVPKHVKHAMLVEPRPPDRALAEEAIIESGWGWCNEQARVLVVLAGLADIPGRLVALYSSETSAGHMTAELFVDGKWGWACATKDCVVVLDDGRWASAAEIWGKPAIRQRFATEWQRCSETWNSAMGIGPYTENPAAMFGSAGIINYPWWQNFSVQEGIEA